MALQIPREKTPEYAGYECEPTHWHKVTQAQINAFADTTLDHQFIHVDEEAAKNTPFGSTIAHGFLTLSMLAHFAETFSVAIEGMVMAMNYGFDRIRFLTPVKVNQEIRAKATIVDITEKNPGQYLIKYDVAIEIKGEEKPALVAEWYGMVIVQ